MNKLKILMDSTGDLNPKLCEQYDIGIIPLTVNLGEKSYVDGVNITPKDVFGYYDETGELATTSAIAPNIFEDVFNRWTKQGYDVIDFSISPLFTSTFNSAQIAAQNFKNVYLVDSESLSTGVGLLALAAARMREEGKSILEILEKVESLKKEFNGSFVIDTLKFLRKGGRCSGLAAFSTNLLSIKPCLEIREGVLNVGKKYRGKLEKVLTDYISNELKDKKNIDTKVAFITHTMSDHDMVERLKQVMLKYQPFEQIIETTAGCTVSVHCGPNTLGIFYREIPQ